MTLSHSHALLREFVLDMRQNSLYVASHQPYPQMLQKGSIETTRKTQSGRA